MICTPKDVLGQSDIALTLSKKSINYSDLLPLLNKYLNDIPFKGKNTFMNIPVVVDPIQLDEYTRLVSLLNKAITQIVTHYFKDLRIRKLYQLDLELEGILRLAKSTPYEVGLYRPDIVLDKNGQSKICEIGCRYPLNGWMLSYYLNCIMEELESSTDCSQKAIPQQTEIISKLSKGFDGTVPLYYVHLQEKGTEAYQFFNELKALGFAVVDISPKELELTNGELTVNGEPATQFILEMDREELKKIKPDVLHALIKSKKCLNDLRSLILVHDKRILSVLYDQSIMLDYLPKEDYDFLKRFLIPSYILESTEKREELIHSTSNWVLKKNSGGRGIDIYVKNDCTPEIWNKVVTDDWQQYMVQEYVDQKTFDLKHDDQTESINMVGMLLCYNNQFFGTGIFRGSSKSVINVHSGGYILPSVTPYLP